jgi:hypothetical protein
MGDRKRQAVIDIDVIGDFPRRFDKAIDAFRDRHPDASVAATVPEMVDKVLRRLHPEVLSTDGDGPAGVTLLAGPRPDLLIGRLRIMGHGNGNYVALSRFQEALRAVNTPDDFGQTVGKRALAAKIYGVGGDETFSFLGNDDALRQLAGKFAQNGHVELHSCYIAPGSSGDLAESRVSYDAFGKYLMLGLARLWQVPVAGGSQKQNPTPGLEGVVSVAYPDGRYEHKEPGAKDPEAGAPPDAAVGPRDAGPAGGVPVPGTRPADGGSPPSHGGSRESSWFTDESSVSGLSRDDADFFAQALPSSARFGRSPATTLPGPSDEALFPTAAPPPDDFFAGLGDNEDAQPPPSAGMTQTPQPALARDDEGFFAPPAAAPASEGAGFRGTDSSGGEQESNEPACRDDLGFFTERSGAQPASPFSVDSPGPQNPDSQQRQDEFQIGDDESQAPPATQYDASDDGPQGPPLWSDQRWKR